MARTGVSNPSVDCRVGEDFRFLTRQSEVASNKVTLIHTQLCIGLSTRNPLITRVRAKLQQQRRTKHGGLFPEIFFRVSFKNTAHGCPSLPSAFIRVEFTCSFCVCLHRH